MTGRRAVLDEGLRALGQEDLDEAQRHRLLAYLDLLARWSKAQNLSAVAEEDMVAHHLLDSLAVRPWLSGETILDIGSGAGLPGIPLAIAEPGRRFVLLDSREKRAAFLRHAAATLPLPNVTVVCARAEDYRPAVPPDTIVSRAVAKLADLDAWTRHLQGPKTRNLAMKGPGAAAEIAAWPRAGELHPRTILLAVPGLPARTLVLWPGGSAGQGA